MTDDSSVNVKDLISKVVEDTMIQNTGVYSIEESWTMEEVIKQQEEADAILGASDPDNCSYSLGYVTRQAIFSCLTCTKPDQQAGICLACSLTCHKDCELVELYTKRNFRCDCGNEKLYTNCDLQKEKDKINEKNTYNHNYKGLYCTCERPYPDPDCPAELEDDEMIQCITCEDWFHGSHLNLSQEILDSDDYGELICGTCARKYSILQHYNCLITDTKPVSATCKRPSSYIELGDASMMLSQTFRKDLCDCSNCKAELKALQLDFLLVEGDSMEEYEKIGKEKIKSQSEEADKSINNMLDNLDCRGKQEIAYGINTLKSAMASMLESAGPTGEVTSDHIEAFKRKLNEDMEQRKRRRTDS